MKFLGVLGLDFTVLAPLVVIKGGYLYLWRVTGLRWLRHDIWTVHHTCVTVMNPINPPLHHKAVMNPYLIPVNPPFHSPLVHSPKL